MEKGKRICQALKELRKRIADANNIPFVLEECTHKGDCPGTCPKCESELRYLMDSIDKLEQEGKPVTLEGIMSEEELRRAFSIEPIEQSISDKAYLKNKRRWRQWECRSHLNLLPWWAILSHPLKVCHRLTRQTSSIQLL